MAEVVIVSWALMVTVKLAVAVFEAESVTFTAKLAAPATGVAPESTPVLERLKPTAVRLLAPDVTDQVYPAPDPPVAASVCE